jgi:SAM-dependent methyltransferase
MPPGSPRDHQDRSNGWEAIAPAFIEDSQRTTVGVSVVRAWARLLPAGASILDLGCGPGTPRTQVLSQEGFALHGIDASPSLAAAYRRRIPGAQVACEPVEESSFFGQTFDGVLAWGLMFLLPAETQRTLIHRVAGALTSGGSLLFTAPAPACTWPDNSTGRPSLSLGANAYRLILADAGLRLASECDDEGENHYYRATRA